MHGVLSHPDVAHRSVFHPPWERGVARTVRIQILDDPFETRCGGSILQALQEYGIARDLPGYGFTRFCWNASCEQCVLTFERGEGREVDYACQTTTCAGMRLHTLPDVLHWGRLLSRG